MNFQDLPPAYLSEIARQLAFLSAFLGGFAATFLATIVVSSPKKGISGWVISLTGFSASFFVVAVVSFVMLVIVLNPNAPKNVTADSSLLTARLVGILSFVLGILGLLASVGLSGWLHSKRVGMATSVAALLGMTLVFWAFLGFE